MQKISAKIWDLFIKNNKNFKFWNPFPLKIQRNISFGISLESK